MHGIPTHNHSRKLIETFDCESGEGEGFTLHGLQIIGKKVVSVCSQDGIIVNVNTSPASTMVEVCMSMSVARK